MGAGESVGTGDENAIAEEALGVQECAAANTTGTSLMRARSESRTFIAAVAGLASGALFAQPSPTVSISFVGASAAAVPLDPWSSLAAGLLIAAAAGVVIGASRVDVVATAHAGSMATPLLLTSSPASIVVGGGAAFIEARNATGATITINSVSLVNAVNGQVIFETEGSCVPGLTLAVGQSCFVNVQLDNS